jgi:hypothetical protein
MAINTVSNLSSIQRVKFEDFKGAPSWFERFLNTLNLFMTAIYNMSNHGITYANLGVIAPFTFQFTPGVTTGFKFANPTTANPTNVIIGNVYEGDQLSIHPIVPIQLFWHYNQGFIFVDSIIGLTSGIQYTISVLVS